MRNADTGRQSQPSETEVATAYVYLVHHPESGAYKIGRSADPENRLTQLAPKSAGLELIAKILTTDSVWLERAMHLTFAHRRIRGEWFALSDEEVAVFTEVGVADNPEDLQNAVHSLYDTNERNGFAWGCTGHPLAELIPVHRSDGRVSCQFQCDRETAEALDDYLADLAIDERPTKGGFITGAIRNYLASKGAWPPPADPPK